MATAVKKRVAKKAVQSTHEKILTPGTKQNQEFEERRSKLRIGMIQIHSPEPRILNCRITGLGFLVTHPFSEKAIKQIEETQMKDQQQVKSKPVRKPKNPIEEMYHSYHWGLGAPKLNQTAKDAGYCNGIPTFPLVAVKNAIVDTIRMQNHELYKKDLQRILFIRGFEDLDCAPIEFNAKKDLHGRLDYVKLANGNPDIRYRPEFSNWSLSFQIEYLPEFWSEEVLLNAIQSAGYLNGIGEYRMERGGSWGRFKVDKMTGKADLFRRIGKAKPQRLDMKVTKIEGSPVK